jgi:hypothetical protein
VSQFVSINLNTPAMLVDTETGTAISAEGVRAIPLDVWNENEMDEKMDEGMSDSAVADFALRYGVPLFVRVNNG